MSLRSTCAVFLLLGVVCGTYRQGLSQVLGRGAPKWFPLTAAEEVRLDKILRFWEFTTDNTKRYRCQFGRWEYDPIGLKTYSKGTIKYAAPDKGLFKVDKIQIRQPPKQPGGDPLFEEQAGGFREHWICDGKSIFEFDHNTKQLKQRQLPKDLQGKRITDGPLPFLFGATAEQIKSRFWMHELPHQAKQGEFFLEGIPKHQADAANFTRINIILDNKDFLPKGMILYHRDQSQTTFAFEQRETNWNIIGQQLNPFINQFFVPIVPRGWQKVVEPIGMAPPNRKVQRNQRAQPR